jgi:hypothetical protein
LVSGIRGIAWAKDVREYCAKEYVRPKMGMWQEAGKYCTMKRFIIWNYSPKIIRVMSRIMIWRRGEGFAHGLYWEEQKRK